MGYRAAIEDAKAFFYNTDIYEATPEEAAVLESEDARECFADWMRMQETETVCSIFEQDEYIDVELTDGNPPLYSTLHQPDIGQA